MSKWFKNLSKNTKNLVQNQNKKMKEKLTKFREVVHDGRIAVKNFIKEEFHSKHHSENEQETKTDDVRRRAVSLEKVDCKRIEDDNELLLCPISQELMTDPVMTPYGHCFQRSCIEAWLGNHDTCPLTGQSLRTDQLIPCFTIKAIVEEKLKLQSN